MREGRIERGLKLLQPVHRTEAPLRVRMREGIGARQRPHRDMVLQPPAGGMVEQRLCRFVRQRGEQAVDARLVRRAHRLQPVARHADVE